MRERGKGKAGRFNKNRKLRTPVMRCPNCEDVLSRTVRSIRAHFLRRHQKSLTEGEAFRMVIPLAAKERSSNPARRRKKGAGRATILISGGLPSLGKHR
jgi:hypothetical protein